MITNILEIEDESDGAPTLCEALSESDEDRIAQQLRKHLGNIMTEAVIAETMLAPIDPPFDEALSERRIDPVLVHDDVTFAEMCHRHRHEDLTAQQLREHWGTLRAEAVIAETAPAPTDPPLDGCHKMEGAGMGTFPVCAEDLAT